MIIDNNKVIFIHIQKTAGTSITHALLSNLIGQETSGPMMDLPKHIQNEYGLRFDLKHASALKIQKHVGKDKWNDYYKFAFIRNPWDRAVSAYHWGHDHNKENKSVSFTEFARMLPTSPNNISATWGQASYSQLSFISSLDGKIIVDDVFQFEKFDIALRTINFKTGIDVVSTIKKHKANRTRKPYNEYYTEETKDIISNMFKIDIEYFGYKF